MRRGMAKDASSVSSARVAENPATKSRGKKQSLKVVNEVDRPDTDFVIAVFYGKYLILEAGRRVLATNPDTTNYASAILRKRILTYDCTCCLVATFRIDFPILRTATTEDGNACGW